MSEWITSPEFGDRMSGSENPDVAPSLAEQIAIDLSLNELSDLEVPLILDVVTRTLEALVDFGYEYTHIDPPDYGTPTTVQPPHFAGEPIFEGLTFIVDPAEEQAATKKEAWADVKLASEIYLAAVDYAVAANLEVARTRKERDYAYERLEKVLADA